MTYLPYLIVLVFVLAFVVVSFLPRIIVTVRPGEAGVLFKRFEGGTQIDRVYPEGIHLLWPWDNMYVYNVRNQVVSRTFDVLTKTGLNITVDVTVRYRPEYDLTAMLHQNVGPDYVNIAVMPVVESTIRGTIGQYAAAEVYTTQRAVLQSIANDALEKAARKYVNIDDVLITKITLPEKIRDAIQAKAEEEQKFEAYQYIKKRATEEADRKRIEAEGIREYQRIVAETLTDKVLLERGISATEELAKSKNSKVVIIGQGDKGLPIILGGK